MDTPGPGSKLPSVSAARPLEYASPEAPEYKPDTFASLSVACGILFILAGLTGGALGSRAPWGVLPLVLLFLLPVLAVTFGLLSARAARRSGHRVFGWPIAGLTLGGTELGLVVIAILLLPSLGRSPATALRVKCMINLRQIGQALFLYADDHEGQFPANLEPLLLESGLSAGALVCPSSHHEVATGPTTQAIIQKIRSSSRHCSYVYVGGGLTRSAMAQHVLAYDPLGNHQGDGMAVLYADGVVDNISTPDARYLIAELQAGHNPPRPRPQTP